LKNDCREYQNNNGPKCSNLVTKIRNILKIVQKYPLYTKEAKQTLKFPDQLNLVDTTEFLANGEIEYRNAILHGMENAVLKDVDFKDINKNLVKYNDNNITLIKSSNLMTCAFLDFSSRFVEWSRSHW
jgi:hypothetical protein